MGDLVGWYAVRTRPRREWAAGADLWRADFSVWVPWYYREVKQSKKVTPGQRHKHTTFTKTPTFRGYIFVHMDQGGIGRVNQMREVQGVVRLGARSLPVPDTLMQALFALAEDDMLDLGQAPESPPDYEAGEWVRLVDGPLAGRLAQVDEATRRDVVLWLEALGGGRLRVHARREQLERVPSDQSGT